VRWALVKLQLEPLCRMQLSFWRRTNTVFTGVPIATLHANNQGAFCDPGLVITDVCGLHAGLTLVATNRHSLLVIDKLKVVKRLEGLDRPLLKLAPLTGKCFVAVSAVDVVEIFDTEREHDIIAGVPLS
jgi:hypothetical protein